jgi:hypothetical protein
MKYYSVKGDTFMKKSIIRTVQSLLKKEGFPITQIDGIFNHSTDLYLDEALIGRENKLPSNWMNLPRTRKITAYIQLVAHENGFDAGVIDAYWGPSTEYAYDSLVHLLEHNVNPPLWRDIKPINVNPNNWPKQTESALNAFYGGVGTNQTKVKLPYTHLLSWNKRKKLDYLYCHKKVADSLVRVLTKVLNHYGEEKIQKLGLNLYGGCYNKRRIRGGSRWSTHAWAIAIDYNPNQNKLKWGRDRAKFAEPVYEKWWEFWEEEGWVSLGREKNFDWMHVQAAKL